MMVLQPGYLPWIGFFEQIYRADVYVIFDDAQYTKFDWRNRNRIKSPTGDARYITVPVHASNTSTVIRDVRIAYDRDWIWKHLNTLRTYYEKAPYFTEVYERIRQIITSEFQFLVDLDVALIYEFMDILGLEAECIFSSELKTPVRGKERLLAVCEELGATHCYNGAAGRMLYSQEAFRQKGMLLEFQEFRCPSYPQLWGDFIPNLSIVDLLCNCGEKSLQIIVQGGTDESGQKS